MKTLLAATLLLTNLAAANAATLSEEAKLVFVSASRVNNSYGGFGGIPGGSGLGTTPSCRLLGNILSLSLDKSVALADDPSRHQKDMKSRVEEVFRSAFMREITGRVANVRRLAYPNISDEDARTIYVLTHDCTLDAVGTGPAVMPIKGNGAFKATYHGKTVPWVLVMSDAAWGKIDGFVSPHSMKYHVPEDVLAHELTHGMTADLLTDANIKRSNDQKTSKVGHDVNRVSDGSIAFWEGLAEGVEATVGETLKGAFAYPFSMDPGVYGFLLERQSPVRNNKMAFDEKGLPRTGGDLVKAEGFVATFIFKLLSRLPYTLSNGITIRGWPFMEVARLIHDQQPTNARELIVAVLNAPNGGEKASEEFLRLSGLATYSREARALSVSTIKARQAFYEISDKLHDAASPDQLAVEYAKRLAEKNALEKQWAEKSEQWAKEALAGARGNILRLAY
ncbi:MAG: hypothetical protein HY075_06340 [Deltaproteobacteria bacterium]|nr:hypothetical protein [Deltaproteobacteria bacterium]